eukprot:scaffold188288_cov40-Prasinocladus_malaysianus.AAC.2
MLSFGAAEGLMNSELERSCRSRRRWDRPFPFWRGRLQESARRRGPMTFPDNRWFALREMRSPASKMPPVGEAQ